MSNESLIKDRPSILERLLKSNGRLFIPLMIAFSQLPFFIGAAVKVFVVQLNAALSNEQLTTFIWLSILAVAAEYLIIIPLIFLLTGKARSQLGRWAESDNLSPDPENEQAAWNQITSLTRKYALISGSTVFIFDSLMISFYMYSSQGVTSNQFFYILFGSLFSGMTIVILSIFVQENLLAPAREVLLPRNFEDQLKGSNATLIFVKFMGIGISLTLISALLLGPIGYHQTYKVLFESIGSQETLLQLRLELIAGTSLAALLSFILALLLSRSTTKPINSLISTFAKVEQGDLSQRAKVIATDELGALAIYFNRMVSRLDELQQNLEKRVDDRTKQLRLSNEVGRIASTILDPETVITKVVNLITESFDYYYSAIFIVSANGRWAELKDASGSAGAILKARHHRLQIGNTSLVGTAISTREPQVALDVGASAVRFNNPLLPNTRSEIAIPLMMGDRVIGALDVQSIREADFKSDNIVTLQSMANQVAIAIENARLFKEMDQTVEELRLVNRQYVASAWADKLKGNQLEYSTKPSGISEPGGMESKEIEVGLNLRDEKIGQIRLETNGDWSPEDQAWVEALATQVAISLENARLVEESQQSALRERLSASIVQKVWSSNSVDSILQTAVRELGRALEASEVAIELNVED